MVQLLLEKGADFNAKGGRCGTALQAASYRGHYEVVQLLLENGADVNAKGGHYGNALNAALYYPRGRVVLTLLNNGFNLESANLGRYELERLQRVLESETNLDQADISRHLQKAQELLERAIHDAEESTSTAKSIDIQGGDSTSSAESSLASS